MQDQKIMKIVRTVRQGVSKKNNKPYEILLVMVEDGSEVEVFGPAKVGDTVTNITYNEQYDKLDGKITKPDKFEEVLASLANLTSFARATYKKVSRLEKELMDSDSGSQGGGEGETDTSEANSPARLTSRKSQAATEPSLEDKLEKWRRPAPTAKPAASPPPKDESEPLPSDEDMPTDLDFELTPEDMELTDDLL